MSGRQVIVDIIGDASQFKNATNQATQSASSFSNVLKGIGQGLGISVFNTVAQGAQMAAGFIGDVVKAGIEEEASISRLTTSLRANVSGWDGNTAAIEANMAAGIALGFSDEEQRNSLALLVAATHDVAKAQEIQNAAMDLARFKGISLSEATDALTKVEAGSYRILKSLGIELKAGATAQEAMNAVEKVAAGQAKEYANTIEGKVLVVQTKWGEVMDRVGSYSLPLLADGLDLVNQGMDVAIPLVEDFVAAWQNSRVRLEGNLSWPFGPKDTPVVDIGPFKDILGGEKSVEDATRLAATGMAASWKHQTGAIEDAATAVADSTDKMTADVRSYSTKSISALQSLTSMLLGQYNTDFNNAMNIQDARLALSTAKTAQEKAQQYAILQGLGDLSKTDYNNWLTILEGLAATTKGQTHQDYLAAIRDLQSLRNAASAPINIHVNYVQSGKVSGLPLRAAGGSASGLTWVGEQGPELVNLPSGSYVNSNSASRSMVGSGQIINITIAEGAYIDGPSIDRLTNLIAQRLNYSTAL